MVKLNGETTVILTNNNTHIMGVDHYKCDHCKNIWNEYSFIYCEKGHHLCDLCYDRKLTKLDKYECRVLPARNCRECRKEVAKTKAIEKQQKTVNRLKKKLDKLISSNKDLSKLIDILENKQ
jgi:hypothetical protein